jgi:ectoine hydroxylase-related dioxygenase (phytanoyl-CoA dioxygenase family)
MQTHFRELDEQGYTILKDLLTPAQVEEAVTALKEIYEREKDVVTRHEPQALRCFNLTARAEIFRQLIQLPRLVACMEYLLGSNYTLSTMDARSPLPGIGAQSLHRDGGGFLPNPPFNVHEVLPIGAQSMFALVEFTQEKGATRLVPGSHNLDMDASTVPPQDEYLFTASPGTVLVYDNRLIHGGGPNTTNEIRYSIQGFCCRGNIKPFLDHPRSIPHDLVESASPLLRRLWGFESQPSWEERPRKFKIVEAPGATPIFPYNSGVPDDYEAPDTD